MDLPNRPDLTSVERESAAREAQRKAAYEHFFNTLKVALEIDEPGITEPAARPSWEDYFLNIAWAVSERASCPRLSVGAVVVSPDRRILSTGYNGSAPGEPHCVDAGCIMEDGHCQRALHAEVNAVSFAARHGVALRDATIYVYGPRDVCRECDKVLRAVGIVDRICYDPRESS